MLYYVYCNFLILNTLTTQFNAFCSRQRVIVFWFLAPEINNQNSHLLYCTSPMNSFYSTMCFCMVTSVCLLLLNNKISIHYKVKYLNVKIYPIIYLGVSIKIYYFQMYIFKCTAQDWTWYVLINKICESAFFYLSKHTMFNLVLYIWRYIFASYISLSTKNL